MVSKILLLASATLALAACGGGGGSNGGGTNSQSYSYDMTENGCATGKHSFSSMGDYCKALTNDSLNNGCAGDLRAAQYQQSCNGAVANNAPAPNIPAPSNGAAIPAVPTDGSAVPPIPAAIPSSLDNSQGPTVMTSQTENNLTYDLQENGCKTGAHAFTTLDDFCSALGDDGLNGGCAQDLRANLYKNECSPLSIH